MENILCQPLDLIFLGTIIKNKFDIGIKCILETQP